MPVLSVLLVASCSLFEPEIPRPKVDLKSLVVSAADILPNRCGGQYELTDIGGRRGEGGSELRGTPWWYSTVEATPEECMVVVFVGAYGDRKRAGRAFTDESPERNYADNWPGKPAYPEYPGTLRADRNKILCLDGSEDQGCREWYYWAQYGEFLVDLSTSDITPYAPQGQVMAKRDFYILVESLDRRIDSALR